MKFKVGTWPENIKMAFGAIISAVSLGYIAILFIDNWILSLAQVIFLQK